MDLVASQIPIAQPGKLSAQSRPYAVEYVNCSPSLPSTSSFNLAATTPASSLSRAQSHPPPAVLREIAICESPYRKTCRRNLLVRFLLKSGHIPPHLLPLFEEIEFSYWDDAFNTAYQLDRKMLAAGLRRRCQWSLKGAKPKARRDSNRQYEWERSLLGRFESLVYGVGRQVNQQFLFMADRWCAV